VPAPLALHLAEPLHGGHRRLLLRLPPGQAGNALRALTPEGLSQGLLAPVAIETAPGALWIAYPAPGRPAPGGRPAGAGSEAGSVASLADLLAAASGAPCARPELLCLLVLAELLACLADLHRQGRCHGLLTPGWVLLGGAPPARLLADCPRDPVVRLAGSGIASALGGPARQAVAQAEGGRWRPPEQAHGAAPSAAADLWAAGGMARRLLAAQIGEELGGADPRTVAARLAGLLARLQSPDPERRPATAEAAALCRELALRALSAWERSRSLPAAGELRYAPPVQRRQVGGAADGRGAGAGGQRGRQSRQRRPVAVARARSAGHAWGVPGVAALVSGPPAAAAGWRGASWLSLVPSLIAGLLSLLLAAALLLGT
jgi:hypothetical protein